ncbi:MAG: gliding motility-associated C-terminal domain-containing protein, partial [Saprospiraceae bacterium]
GGTIQLTAVSGQAPFAFQLDGGVWQPSGTFTDLPAGIYSVTLRDAAGCTQVNSYSITAAPPLQLMLESLGPVDCRHAQGYLTLSASGGTEAYTYQLDPGEQQSPSGYFTGLSAGLYTVSVLDALGCRANLDNLEVQDLRDSALTRETVTIYEGGYFQLPDGRRIGKAGEYFFPFLSGEGCDSLHIIELIVRPRQVYVPNIFSPDADEENDFFTVFSDESLAIVRRLQVFDRWGELVFEKQDLPSNQPEIGWNGSFRGQPVSTGVFVWLAELEFVDGMKRTIWGDVTVIR